MIITKKEELSILKMYNKICESGEETLDQIHLAERIIKKERSGVKEKEKKKKKDERMAYLGLKQLGVNPHIYHFETKTFPFAGITIAENIFTWCSVRATIDGIINDVLPAYPKGKATRLKEELAQRNIYGVSICDYRDEFNRQRGRTIAKGRLLKHLKQEDNKKRNEQ